MATASTLAWLSWSQPPSGFTHSLLDVHETAAKLMWAYLSLHAGAAVLHGLLGHRLLRQISALTP